MKQVFDVAEGIFSSECDIYIELCFPHFFNVAILHFLCFRYFVLKLQRSVQSIGRPRASKPVFHITCIA
jgi:hypothetical protein